MHSSSTYTGNPAPVKPGLMSQRTSCIMRTDTRRVRVSGPFLEVTAYIREYVRAKREGTC